MVTMFNDGVLEATLYSSKWVFCRWAQNQHGRLQKRLIKDLNFIEQTILDTSLAGWFTSSEVGHKAFHRLLEKFGCKAGAVEGNFQYFVKPILKGNDLHVWR